MDVTGPLFLADGVPSGSHRRRGAVDRRYKSDEEGGNRATDLPSGHTLGAVRAGTGVRPDRSFAVYQLPGLRRRCRVYDCPLLVRSASLTSW